MNRIAHASNRAWERYGINLQSSMIVFKIECGEGTMLKDYGDSQRWLVDYEGVKLDVIYDKQMRCLATVLPPTRNHPEIERERPLSGFASKRAEKLARDKRDRERAFER